MEETKAEDMLDKMIKNLSSDDNNLEVQELKQKMLREENERLRFEK